MTEPQKPKLVTGKGFRSSVCENCGRNHIKYYCGRSRLFLRDDIKSPEVDAGFCSHYCEQALRASHPNPTAKELLALREQLRAERKA